MPAAAHAISSQWRLHSLARTSAHGSKLTRHSQRHEGSTTRSRWLESVDNGPDQFAQVLRVRAQRHAAGLQPRGIQQVGDQPIESVGFFFDLSQQFGAILVGIQRVWLTQA